MSNDDTTVYDDDEAFDDPDAEVTRDEHDALFLDECARAAEGGL